MSYSDPPETHPLAALAASELRAEMARQHRTGRDLAEVLGVSPMSASRRLRGETVLDVAELGKVAEWLGIPAVRFVTADDAA